MSALNKLGAVETRMANDVEELLKWMEDDNAIPRTISDAAFQPDRLLTLSSRLSAAYKGINVLILREGAKDFFWKANIRELDADEVALVIHHILPKGCCEKRKSPICHPHGRILLATAFDSAAN